MTQGTFGIRALTPWPPLELSFGSIRISTELASRDADALLCVHVPQQELLTFSGLSAWYNCEPVENEWMVALRQKAWGKLIRQLRPEQHLFHANPNPRFRVPHLTHLAVPEPFVSAGREGVVAVVSNFGGPPTRRSPAVVERNRLITRPQVDLFGPLWSWKRYRATRFSRSRVPANYRGAIPGTWGHRDKWDAMARYRVAVCLENSQEPYYFTEKFVDAVIAGCVPVYRAHATVREAFLNGAAWIDPADYNGDPDATLAAAFSADVEAVADQNRRWLLGKDARWTSRRSVLFRIASILLAQRESG